MAFHPYNVIRRKDKRDVSLADFRAANPNVPLVDGQFFQLDTDRLIIMNERGEGNIVDMADYSALIESIVKPPIPPKTKVFPIDIDPHTYLELDSIVGSEPSGDGVPRGYTVVKGVQTWQYRDRTIAEISASYKKSRFAEIIRLEGQITPRREREAILGIDNGWLAAQEALITIERAKLK
jgi:hypothetical protein